MFTEHSLRLVNYDVGKEVEFSNGGVKKASKNASLIWVFSIKGGGGGGGGAVCF